MACKFLVIGDFHYKKKMYSATIADLNRMLKRAADEKVDFVIHMGDFCNDYPASPELTKAYLENEYGLTVYGIDGNHELECMNVWHETPLDLEHPMQYFVPFLTNDIDGVVWGTPNGKPAKDWSIAYYYFDKNGIRFVCLDTEYSYNQELDEWQHNPSLYVPKGNIVTESLGREQRAWAEAVLTDAAEKNIPCIVFTHIPFRRDLPYSRESAVIREMIGRVNQKRKGTVVAAISGHLHTDHDVLLDENVLYIDINTSTNGHWIREGVAHYGPEHTFDFENYDAKGNFIGIEKMSYGDLRMGTNTWFFTDPLSAIVTVEDDGTVAVEGMETTWAYGIEPPQEALKDHPATRPKISSGVYKVER